ncbi:MAG: hypothetical protein ACP5PW_06360, partial [Candidatus Dormibacteria bacterium]
MPDHEMTISQRRMSRRKFMILGIQATPQAVRAFNAANGYDKPILVQFFVYWRHLLEGNLGFS